MLTPASTVSTPATYETAPDEFDSTPGGNPVNEVDETIDIAERIRDVLPVKIPPLTAKQLEQAFSIGPPDGPQYCCWFYREVRHTMYTRSYLIITEQRYCAFQSYLYDQTKAVTEGVSLETRGGNPGNHRVKRANPP